VCHLRCINHLLAEQCAISAVSTLYLQNSVPSPLYQPFTCRRVCLIRCINPLLAEQCAISAISPYLYQHFTCRTVCHLRCINPLLAEQCAISAISPYLYQPFTCRILCHLRCISISVSTLYLQNSVPSPLYLHICINPLLAEQCAISALSPYLYQIITSRTACHLCCISISVSTLYLQNSVPSPLYLHICINPLLAELCAISAVSPYLYQPFTCRTVCHLHCISISVSTLYLQNSLPSPLYLLTCIKLLLAEQFAISAVSPYLYQTFTCRTVCHLRCISISLSTFTCRTVCHLRCISISVSTP